MVDTPTCPVCCGQLGECGGPTTLPCGHNGCVGCLRLIQHHQSLCPICRHPFGVSFRLDVNTQLRDLLAQVTSLQIERDSLISEKTETVSSNQNGSQSANVQDIEGGGTSVLPSAPPMSIDGHEIPTIERADWIPDSASNTCMGCGLPFILILRSRHHCRLCGKLFCNACSSRRVQITPALVAAGDFIRVCNTCATLTGPRQRRYDSNRSRADRIPINDKFGWSSLCSWLNNPLSLNMESNIYKATNILRTFNKMFKRFPDIVPETCLKSAEAVVVMSEFKSALGFWSLRSGTGIIVSRADESAGWSRPCALGSLSIGAGLQVGGALVDVVIVLPDKQSLKAFTDNAMLTFGGSASVSIGIGTGFRLEFLSYQLNEAGACFAKGYGFFFCRGAFAGASLDGTVVLIQNKVNREFYGEELSPHQLLWEEPSRQLQSTKHLNQSLDEVFGNRMHVAD